jgi:flagellar basal body-associated protein FliL
MKKFVAIILVAVCGFSAALFFCGNKQKKAETAKEASEAEAAVALEEAFALHPELKCLLCEPSAESAETAETE